MANAEVGIDQVHAKGCVVEKRLELRGALTQGFLGPLASSDVLENDRNATPRFVLDRKRVEFQHAPLRNKSLFKLDRLAGSQHGVVGDQPFLGFIRNDLPNRFPDHVAYA